MQFDYAHCISIFDCDGVVFESNQLKIDAMKEVLYEFGFKKTNIEDCIAYFSDNFGKSRYHHVAHFVSNILHLEPGNEKQVIISKIINLYSLRCENLYLKAEVTPGFIDFIESIDSKKYIASGSSQDELRYIFRERNLDSYFSGIFGSPTNKSDIVKTILELENSSDAIMFGDSISDLEASIINNIKFIGYRPYSNVPDLLTKQSYENGFITIDHWNELL